MGSYKIILVESEADIRGCSGYDDYNDVETFVNTYDSLTELIEKNPKIGSELTTVHNGWKSPKMIEEEKKVNKKLSKAKPIDSFLTYENKRLGVAQNYDINNIGHNYTLEKIAKGKFKLLQEIDPKSLLSEDEKKKLKEIKNKMAKNADKRKETAKKKQEAKKAKEIEKAKKLLEEAGELK